ncbi:ABC transporter ATP-binding protein [Streptomyces sp. HNM0575]|uniref:ABC transporter transmembrane domain-containing protein n=1 Tax=Streptomyces sp. HNM0575 TaxID=2716338 RepID=UPI00145F7A19|nr:ABC transporter ATP-binding protein [Streptomyces sp. HNM0575]
MLIRLLCACLRPYRWRTVLLLVLQLVQTVATLMLPTLNAAVIDDGVVKGDADYIVDTGIVMLALAVTQIVTAGIAAVLSSRITAALGRDLRSRVFRHVMRLSSGETTRFGTSSLSTRTVNDVVQIQRLTLTLMDVAVSAVIMCAGGLLLGLYQDTGLGLLLIGLVAVIGICLSVLLRRLGPPYALMQRCVDTMARLLREQISGVRVIRAFVRDGHERERFGKANDELFGVSLRVGRIMATIPVTLMVFMNVLTVALVWFAGLRINDGALRLGALNAVLGYLTLIIVAIIVVSFVFTEAPRARASAVRIEEVLNTPTSVPVPETPVDPWVTTGHLDVRRATFGYPGAQAPVLQDVSLKAGPGETIAVLGGTGSGKTTLLSLVLRLNDVTDGAVFVSGVDVRDMDPDILADSVGFVPQRPYLFAGTVASNLRYGNPEAGDEELWHALDVAQATEFVERMQNGLDSRISQGGSNISGGQRQRLAIARAVLGHPLIYLLDDCFSALDQGTESALRAALEEETAAATVLLVTQRIGSVQGADRIVVLDGGRVVGDGTHEELLHDSRAYREMAASQSTVQEVTGALADA